MPNIELTHISVGVKLEIGEPRRNNTQFCSLSPKHPFASKVL